MTYENVYKILEENDRELCEEYSDITGELTLMRELAALMRDLRLGRGALDFETKESVITLDEKGAPVSIEAEKLTFANQLIEEFMIACNEIVASHLTKAAMPLIFRTHNEPDPKKIDAFYDLVIGLRINPGLKKPKKTAPEPAALQEILNTARKTKYYNLLSYILLRSLAKADYTSENTGHFGLASECYCHFTSPIRRYPDLVVHRLLKTLLKRGGLSREDRKKYDETLENICVSCSERERAADEAEREIEALKKAEYMKKYLGDEFKGNISGVAPFGMFVMLKNTVEGLVRVGDMLDDYYEFDDELFTLTGSYSDKEYKIGDSVKVVLTRVDIGSRQIDFMLSNM